MLTRVLREGVEIQIVERNPERGRDILGSKRSANYSDSREHSDHPKCKALKQKFDESPNDRPRKESGIPHCHRVEVRGSPEN